MDLIAFKGAMIFTSHDQQFIQTVANRIIEIHDDGTIFDKLMNYDEYLEWKEQQEKQKKRKIKPFPLIGKRLFYFAILIEIITFV